MTVISIQSQVAFGHVGNSAATFPIQLHGIDVVAVPTTLLSNRPICCAASRSAARSRRPG
ncbi:MAG: pyridoxine kinase [Pseudomonadota bacterium]|jgi:pyridoxine kinase